jgi:hypothetical protein
VLVETYSDPRGRRRRMNNRFATNVSNVFFSNTYTAYIHMRSSMAPQSVRFGVRSRKLSNFGQ